MELRDRKKLQRLMIVQEVSQRELATAAGWKSHTYPEKLLRGEKRTLETEPALRIAYALTVGGVKTSSWPRWILLSMTPDWTLYQSGPGRRQRHERHDGGR